MSQDIRWKQRFDNFRRAYNLLGEVVMENSDISELEAIVQEGIAKRFEFTFELAWKTLKDKMASDGLTITKASPKPLLKLAYQSGYIQQVDTWIAMVNDRNLLTHKYSFNTFSEVLQRLQKQYYPIITELYDSLLTDYLSE